MELIMFYDCSTDLVSASGAWAVTAAAAPGDRQARGARGRRWLPGRAGTLAALASGKPKVPAGTECKTIICISINLYEYI